MDRGDKFFTTVGWAIVYFFLADGCSLTACLTVCVLQCVCVTVCIHDTMSKWLCHNVCVHVCMRFLHLFNQDNPFGSNAKF